MYDRVLGIGRRTEKRLHLMGIETIEQLAHASPDLLRSRMGIIGEQLYHHAHGIDRTILSEPTPQVMEKATAIAKSYIAIIIYKKKSRSSSRKWRSKLPLGFAVIIVRPLVSCLHRRSLW